MMTCKLIYHKHFDLTQYHCDTTRICIVCRIVFEAIPSGLYVYKKGFRIWDTGMLQPLWL